MKAPLLTILHCTLKAFICRANRRHTQDLDSSNTSIMFKRLCNSDRAWIGSKESTWVCQRCKVKNKMAKGRCFVCQGWQGGRHSFQRPGGVSTPPESETGVVDIPEGKSELVVSKEETSSNYQRHPSGPSGSEEGATFQVAREPVLAEVSYTVPIKATAAEPLLGQKRKLPE